MDPGLVGEATSRARPRRSRRGSRRGLCRRWGGCWRSGLLVHQDPNACSGAAWANHANRARTEVTFRVDAHVVGAPGLIGAPETVGIRKSDGAVILGYWSHDFGPRDLEVVGDRDRRYEDLSWPGLQRHRQQAARRGLGRRPGRRHLRQLRPRRELQPHVRGDPRAARWRVRVAARAHEAPPTTRTTLWRSTRIRRTDSTTARAGSATS